MTSRKTAVQPPAIMADLGLIIVELLAGSGY